MMSFDGGRRRESSPPDKWIHNERDAPVMTSSRFFQQLFFSLLTFEGNKKIVRLFFDPIYPTLYHYRTTIFDPSISQGRSCLVKKKE